MLNLRSTLLTVGILTSSSLLLLLGHPGLAQTSAADLQPWEGGGQTDAASSANDPLNSRTGTGASSLFDLMNRIQTLQGQTSEEFARNQQENFNSAVEDFQKKQQEAIDSLPEE